jgi:hypothetical protein
MENKMVTPVNKKETLASMKVRLESRKETQANTKER